MRKLSLNKLHKKLWNLISKYVRITEGKCYTCGVVKDYREMDCGHFLHKAKNSKLAYERKLLHCQCSRCNRYLSGNLLEYTIRMIKDYGLPQAEKWKQESNKIYKWKREELEKLIEEYKSKLEALSYPQ